MSFCNKDQLVRTSKDYCQLKKTRYLKLRNLVLFFVWEDARVHTHWHHSSDMCLSYLETFSFCVPSECTIKDGCSGWLLDGRAFCYYPCIPYNVMACWLQRSLFTDMVGIFFFLIIAINRKLNVYFYYDHWSQADLHIQIVYHKRNICKTQLNHNQERKHAKYWKILKLYEKYMWVHFIFLSIFLCFTSSIIVFFK